MGEAEGRGPSLAEGGRVTVFDGFTPLSGTARNVRPLNGGWEFDAALVLMHGPYEMPAWVDWSGRGMTDDGAYRVQADFVLGPWPNTRPEAPNV